MSKYLVAIQVVEKFICMTLLAKLRFGERDVIWDVFPGKQSQSWRSKIRGHSKQSYLFNFEALGPSLFFILTPQSTAAPPLIPKNLTWG